MNATGNRRNWRLQEIKDGVNTVIKRVARAAPYLFDLTGESTLTIIGGTSVYQLDDYCYRPLSLWTEDANAHKLMARWPRNADRDGSRNPNMAYPSSGPWQYVWQPRNAPIKSGASGATTGASATAGTTTITLGASATALVAADIGRMIRLNGEQADYKIVTIGAAGRVPTVDRPIQGRIQVAQADLTDGVAAAYTNVRWDLGHPEGFRLKILPAVPSSTPSMTVYYRYIIVPRIMVNNDDTPPFPEEYHDLIWKGAIAELSLSNENTDAYQAYKTEYESRLAELVAMDNDQDDSDEGPRFESLDDDGGYSSKAPIDAYFRSY